MRLTSHTRAHICARMHVLAHAHTHKHTQVHRHTRASKERLSTVYLYVYKLENYCVLPKMLVIITFVVYSSVNE